MGIYDKLLDAIGLLETGEEELRMDGDAEGRATKWRRETEG